MRESERASLTGDPHVKDFTGRHSMYVGRPGEPMHILSAGRASDPGWFELSGALAVWVPRPNTTVIASAELRVRGASVVVRVGSGGRLVAVVRAAGERPRLLAWASPRDRGETAHALTVAFLGPRIVEIAAPGMTARVERGFWRHRPSTFV